MKIRGGPGVRVIQRGDQVTISATARNTTTTVSAGDTRWIAMTAPTLTSSTTSFQIAETAISLDIGTPIRWIEAASESSLMPYYEYAVITDAVNDDETTTTYSYAGVEMVAPTSLAYDAFRLSTMVHLFVAGEYANATGTDILWTLKSVRFKWLGAPSYLVQILACQGTNATTTQPKINITIDDSTVSTGGVQLVSSSFVYNTATDIDSDAYEALYGDIVKLAVTTAAVGATKAKDLTVQLLFVSE